MESVKLLSEEEIDLIAKEFDVHKNMICCVCGILIQVMAFRHLGVCCENHRKQRDNDLEPAQVSF
jgi:hypothetical protein